MCINNSSVYDLSVKEKYLIKFALFSLLSEINNESDEEYKLLSNELMLPIVQEFTQSIDAESLTKVYENNTAFFIEDSVELIHKLK